MGALLSAVILGIAEIKKIEAAGVFRTGVYGIFFSPYGVFRISDAVDVVRIEIKTVENRLVNVFSFGGALLCRKCQRFTVSVRRFNLNRRLGKLTARMPRYAVGQCFTVVKAQRLSAERRICNAELFVPARKKAQDNADIAQACLAVAGSRPPPTGTPRYPIRQNT